MANDNFWSNLSHNQISIRRYLMALIQQPQPPRCPDCGETEFTHCPLDDADYICKGCGLWYN